MDKSREIMSWRSAGVPVSIPADSILTVSIESEVNRHLVPSEFPSADSIPVTSLLLFSNNSLIWCLFSDVR